LILALDPSTRLIGWAVLLDGHYEGSGIHVLPEDLNDACAEAYEWLRFAHYPGFKVIALEIPVLHFGNVTTLRSLAYINGALRAAVAGRAKVVDVNPSKRLKAMGIGKVDDKKAAIVDAVNKRFKLSVASHDEADAIAIGLAAQEILDAE
jgi:Holliday junction resolvasome RuvABC endonuclease subunit